MPFSDWPPNSTKPIKCLIYKPACIFWNEQLNFATNFRTSQRSSKYCREKLSEIDCNVKWKEPKKCFNDKYDFERPNFLIGTYFNLIILQVTYFLSSLVLAYAVGFMIAVVVELPCANLEALFWRKWEKK